MFNTNQNFDSQHQMQAPFSLENFKHNKSFDVARRQRSGIFQQRRNLYLANENSIDWKRSSVQELSQIVQKEDNPFICTKLLFELSRVFQWRKWNPVMQQILRKLQNTIVRDSQLLSGYSHIPSFQQAIELMCGLNCSHFQAHLLMFISTILRFNHIYNLIDELKLSENLFKIAKNHSCLASKVYWELAGMAVTVSCVLKVLDSDSLFSNALPVCTLLANFVVDNHTLMIGQVLNHKRLKNLSEFILNNPESPYQTIRQLQLVYNNLLSKDRTIFDYVVLQSELLPLLLAKDTQETWITISLLQKASYEGIETAIDQIFLQNTARTLKSYCPAPAQQILS